MEPSTPDISPNRASGLLLWTAHGAAWLLGVFSARLSRVGSQLEVHITGRNDAELAPEHLRMILTAPTTEFKMISCAGVVACLLVAALLWKPSPRALRWLTVTVAVICVLVYVAGYGIG